MHTIISEFTVLLIQPNMCIHINDNFAIYKTAQL